MNFGGNLCKIYINTQKKNQEAVTSVDNKIKVLRFVHTEIISHLAQRQFFFRKKPCQTKGIDYRKAKLLHNKYKYMAHKQWKFQGAAPSMKDVIKMLRGVNLSGAHCSRISSEAIEKSSNSGGGVQSPGHDRCACAEDNLKERYT